MATIGRPPNPDEATLAAMADQITENPTMKPTAAFLELGIAFAHEHLREAARRRVVTKFNKNRVRLMQAAADRKRPPVAYRSHFGMGTSRSATDLMREAISNLPSEILRDALDRAFPWERVLADLGQAQRHMPPPSVVQELIEAALQVKRFMPPPSVLQEAIAAAEQAQHLFDDSMVR